MTHFVFIMLQMYLILYCLLIILFLMIFTIKVFESKF